MATKATRVVLGPFFTSGVLETSIKVYTYEPGTTTNKTTWEDRDKASAESNPVVGDANGVCTFFADGLYKFRIDDSDDNTLYTWDNYQVGQLTEDERPIIGLGFQRDTDTDHDVEINIGAAQDDGGTEDMSLTSPITKQIDAAWAVGDDAGGIDTGSVTTNTWYYLWLIKRTDTNVVDVLFSTDSTDPTMPTNYDKKRRIGSLLTDASSNILALFNEAGSLIPEVLALKDGGELTIASGVVTATNSFHTIDTESDASTDDLDTINGAKYDNQILVVRAADDARTVVLKDATGNLHLSGDITLDNSQDTALLIWDGSNWLELSEAGNTA